MLDESNYDFKTLKEKIIKREKFIINVYVNECLK